MTETVSEFWIRNWRSACSRSKVLVHTKNRSGEEQAMNKLVEIFYDADDFCRFFIPQWEQFCFNKGYRWRRRQGHIHSSEIMTILILFHMSPNHDLKNFYLEHIWKYHHNDFPTLLSYTHSVSVALSVLVPLCRYLTQLKGKPTGMFLLIPRVYVCAITSRSPAIRSLRG